jgi:hypothetical protein
MRNSLLVKVIVFLLAALLLVQPLLAQMAQDEYVTGRMEGANAAQVNTTLWFFAGCLLGWVGLLLAYVIAPEVPSQHLIGKSAEYARGFTEGYQEKAKKKQTTNALYGCIVGTVAYIGCYVIYVAAVVSAADDENL